MGNSTLRYTWSSCGRRILRSFMTVRMIWMRGCVFALLLEIFSFFVQNEMNPHLFPLWSRLAHCPKTAPLFHLTEVVGAPLPAGAPPVVPMVEQAAGLVRPMRI